MQLSLDTPAKVKAFAAKVQEHHQKLIDGDYKDIDTFFNEEDEMEKELEECQKTLPKGLHVGKLVCFGVADGYAKYLIVKVGKRVSKLVHLPFGDAYRYMGVDAERSVLTSTLRPWHDSRFHF